MTPTTAHHVPKVWLAGLSVLLALSGGARAAEPPPSGALPDAAQLELDRLHAGLARTLSLKPGLTIQADLRSAVQAMVDKELPRLRAVLSSWLDAERRERPAAHPSEHFRAVTVRAYNEMALWQLDSDGSEHDIRQQQAFAHPRSCDIPDGTGTLLGALAKAWQQVPRDQRTEFLSSEARLLGRWGIDREPAPARPTESVEESAWKSIDEYVDKGATLPRPLPPLLAYRVLAEPNGTTMDRTDPEHRCVIRQWALSAALAKGGGRLSEAEWSAHRYARMPEAEYWWGEKNTADAKPGDYPALASRLRIEGTITLLLKLDGQGRAHDIKVVKRAVTAPGIRAQRPVAYETLLDQASIARAASMTHGKPSLEELKDRLSPRRLEIDFKFK